VQSGSGVHHHCGNDERLNHGFFWIAAEMGSMPSVRVVGCVDSMICRREKVNVRDAF